MSVVVVESVNEKPFRGVAAKWPQDRAARPAGLPGRSTEWALGAIGREVKDGGKAVDERGVGVAFDPVARRRGVD